MACCVKGFLCIELVSLLLLLSLCISPSIHVHAQMVEFTIQTIDGESIASRIDGPVSVVLDSNDFPHVMYSKIIFFADEYTYIIRHAYYDGAYWHFETLETYSPFLFGCSGDLDSNNFPHIAYAHKTGAEQVSLTYAYYDGTSWDIQQVDGGQCGYPSLILDSHNNPHISYYENQSKTIRYAYHNGFSWHIQTIDNFPMLHCWGRSIAIDSHNRPHIVYFKEPKYPTISLTHAYFNDTSWVIETVTRETFAYPSASIAIDSHDNPHISYCGSTGRLGYACFNGTSWNPQLIPGSERDDVQSISIALDSYDNPHIGYCDLGGRSLRYAYYDSGLWNVKTVDGTSGGVYGPIHNSIAVDSKNNTHISYLYLTRGGGILRYATTQISVPFFETLLGKAIIYGIPIATIIVLIVIYSQKKNKKLKCKQQPTVVAIGKKKRDNSGGPAGI